MNGEKERETEILKRVRKRALGGQGEGGTEGRMKVGERKREREGRELVR